MRELMEALEEYPGWYAVRFKKTLYSKFSLYNACYVFLDRAYFLVDEEGDDYVVYLRPKGEGDGEALARELANQMVNYERYFANIRENNEVAKLIIQRALFSSSPSLVQEAEEKEIEELIKELEQDAKE